MDPFNINVPASLPFSTTEPEELLQVVLTMLPCDKVGAACIVKIILAVAFEQLASNLTAVKVRVAVPDCPAVGVNTGFNAFALSKVPITVPPETVHAKLA